MKLPFNWKYPYPSKRMPILAENVVSTSQPLASQAGLQMIMKGGNAVDAAIASAICLTVVEPVSNGIGSDAFVILNRGDDLHGLNASGRSPFAWSKEHFSKYNEMPIFGWDTTTVPGAVSAWVTLWKKFGSLEFKTLFEPAIKYARDGFIVSPIVGMSWNLVYHQYKNFPEWVNTFTVNGKPPKPGQLFKCPEQVKTLELIAETEGEAFYRGEIAKKIANHAQNTGGLITREDLKNHRPEWVNPLSIEYKGVKLHEIPPNGQGIAALIMLGIVNHLNLSKHPVDSIKSLHLQIEAMKLAFSDAYRYVSDSKSWEFDPQLLLNPDYLKQQAKLVNLEKATKYYYGKPKVGGTVYLTAADAEETMISFIQSNFWSFGSGIVIPDTGISLQNRGHGFTLEENHPNQVGPHKRPYHTIIPGFVTRNDIPLMSFGVMGGSFQPQGHAQMMIRIFEYGQNPQAAIDAFRWQVTSGLGIKLEEGMDNKTIDGLRLKNHGVSLSPFIDFGGAQLIYKLEDGYLAASEPRKDGQAVGF